MAYDIAAWSEFGVAVVSGAAALTGLLFVAVSINSAWLWSAKAHRDRAGQALVLFIVPLVTGILVLIPGQGTAVLGTQLIVFGLLVGRALLALGGGRLTGDPEWLVLIDRFSPRLITTAALIVGGVSLIARRLGGLYWLAGVDVCALLAGLLNAWIFLLAAGAEKET
jgi:hypothetical protein